jgi:N-acetylglucosaminyldiphosphoundecaprenol N-acetyl-beta-D-mannosaminyltransferase
MACGLVCTCSNNSSLGEIAADAALTFDPAKPEEIAEAIRRGLTDAPLRAELRRKGLLRAAEFDWAKHAAKLAGQFQGFAEVFGIRFRTGTMDQALDEIDSMLKHPRPDGQPYFCAFANADCLNIAYKNARYTDILNKADAVWADGVGIAISAHLMHTPVHGNVNGTDMLPLLCRRGWSLYLFGAAPGVAEKARKRLLAEFPMAKIVGADHGFCKTPEQESAVINRINAAKPDILLVAMGVPKQEEWIVSHRAQLNCGIAVGVGGLFDFASGRIPRAPMWMRKLKIEWTYRLYNEPVRLFRRYIIGNPLFIWRVVLHGSQIRHRRDNHD